MGNTAFRNYAPDSFQRIHEGLTQISKSIVKSSSESFLYLLGFLDTCLIPAPNKIEEALILEDELINGVLMLAEFIPLSAHFFLLLAMAANLNDGVPRDAWSPVYHL